MTTGVQASKAVGYSTVKPPFGASKVVAYSVTGPPNLAISKLVAYSVARVVNVQGGFTGSGDLYLSGNATSKGRLVYESSNSGSIHLSGLATSFGRHVGICTGSGSLHLRGVGNCYNYIGVPPYGGGTSPVMDLIMPIDAADQWMCATNGGVGGPGMGVEDFWRSAFIINTEDYDGVCTYYHQIIAKNEDESDHDIILKDWSGNAISSITVPARTTEWTFFSVPFTPTPGEQRYYWFVPFEPWIAYGYSEVSMATGRVVVKQVGATKTMVWRPVADAEDGNHFSDYLDISLPRLWGYYGPEEWQDIESTGGVWYWNSALYQAGGVTIVLEATCGGGSGETVTECRLYDITGDIEVPGTSFFVTSGGIFETPNANVGRKEINVDLLTSGHLYKMQFRLYNITGGVSDWILGSSRFQRGAFYVKLQNVTKLEVAWRVAKDDGGDTTNHDGSSRARIDNPGGSTVGAYMKNETCSKSVTGEFDYWITDDGHLAYGDAETAVAITGSDAHQSTDTTLLPIFSGDFSDYFVSGDYYCQRGIPETGATAESIWTLVLLGLESQWSPAPCSICIEREGIPDPCATRELLNDVCAEITEADVLMLANMELDPLGFAKVQESPICFERECKNE